VSKAAAQKSRPKTSGPTGRRERNKLEKQARIVAAARDLFQRQGYSETTTLQIAEAADIGTGTLFLYARSKEDLLIMVFKDEMLGTAQAIFAQLSPEVTIVEQMMTVFQGMTDYHARNIELSRVLLREMIMPGSPERRSEISELLDAIHVGLIDIIRSANPDTAIDPELAASSAFGLYYYALISWLGGGLDLDDCLQLLRKQLCALLERDN
jgi:AcrR family transcriptional regulator